MLTHIYITYIILSKKTLLPKYILHSLECFRFYFGVGGIMFLITLGKVLDNDSHPLPADIPFQLTLTKCPPHSLCLLIATATYTMSMGSSSQP